MGPVRIIARLDVRDQNLIKGIHLEGVRALGDPHEFALKYYHEGIDEILYLDAVASLYGRKNLLNVVSDTCRDVFVPVTAGGGIRCESDAEQMLAAGADKIAINTGAIKNPQILSQIAKRFGSQCVVLSIEAKRVGENRWEAYCDYGRERSGLDVLEWAQRGVDLGAGELLVTSIDRDGTCRGFDIPLMATLAKQVPVPVIASGGLGSAQHFIELLSETSVDAVAVGSALHYKKVHLTDMRSAARNAGILVRELNGS